MSENLQKLLGDFLKETGLKSVATGIIDFDGKELAYAIHGTFDKDFNSQRAASVFAMVVNFLNKTLVGIYSGSDEVDEILVTSKGGYFILGVIESEKCFQGVAISKNEDIEKIRGLMKKYRPLFADQL
ncbi:MAG: hypothetical protein GY864_06615 [Desulfobacterales bacterium]|nr:hypothetical protein [Desulfobacterales bacterium]